ncbi:DNRLRE domain-containing protein [Chondromyces apiculatus]|uniref:Carbohydrate-binding module family 96 domain-containing protein n=1 Tax=Chondromyces apiculatus DSM 436 TaxID=1192034 RepID=A0A017T121_9BACT|nr:DNRLRE domain-containing protein [Chondromyces apiculatus]EYF02687.1 Hypothetical protein CAP_6577 [Chondromyces apiculatus DSM 436]
MTSTKHFALLCAVAVATIPACMTGPAPGDDALTDEVGTSEEALSSAGAVCLGPSVATKDAVIYEIEPGWNNGASEQLSVGFSSNSGLQESLLQFDVSGVPAGATIVSATMTLHQLYRTGTPATVNVHEVNVSWAENSVTWNSFGAGAASSPSTSFGVNNDIVPRQVSLTSLVQSWADGTPNNGLLLAEPGLTQTAFRSRESTKTTQRPTLDVCYVTCTDGIQNGNETAVDCGGDGCAPCATCDDGVQNGLETGVDCGGACAPCATCDDGVQNGGEGGVDCGGSCSAACPTCSDGVQNGGEGGVDCGGPCSAACPTCSDGVQNGGEGGVDCGGLCSAACPTCSDGVQNGGEGGVDCGGPCSAACPTCSDGVQNGGEGGVDCGGTCSAACPTCHDGVQNGGEGGVDCGGTCSAACATCHDGVKNGSETGVDCGGSCSACTPTPPASTCGNGIKEAGEQCDGHDTGSLVCTVVNILLPACTSSCKLRFPLLCSLP